MPKRPNPAVKIAQETAHNAVFDEQGNTKPGVHNVLLKAVEVQRPLVLANLRRLQRRYPQDSPAQLAAKLERHYLFVISGGGAAVGATAVVPGIGTAASLGLSALATVGFLETTALYASSLAELHGIRLTDPERSRTMVMAIMLGEEGTSLLGALSGQSLGRGKGVTNAWGRTLTKKIPGSGFGVIRDTIQRAFLKNLLKKQGGAFLGRALPFGVGAVVGGAGNLMMGRAVVASAKEAFGVLPDTVPGELLPNAPKGGSLDASKADLPDVPHTAVPGTTHENPTLEGGNSGSER